MLDVLSQPQTVRIDRVLRALLVKAEVRAIMLCNEAGYVLAEQAADAASIDFAQSQNIAALASGSFFATREMARIVGEKAFTCVLHQGLESGIFIMIVAQTMILVVVFDQHTNPGLVKLFTEAAARELEATFRLAEQDKPEPGPAYDALQTACAGGIFERA